MSVVASATLGVVGATVDVSSSPNTGYSLQWVAEATGLGHVPIKGIPFFGEE
jgi:hypothetical protein